MITKYYDTTVDGAGGSAPVDSGGDNFHQVIPNSHCWTSIEMLLNYLTHINACPSLVEYLKTGLQNTLKNGHDIQPSTPSPSLPSELKELIDKEANRLFEETTMGLLGEKYFIKGAEFALSLNADQVEAKEGKGDEGWISVDDHKKELKKAKNSEREMKEYIKKAKAESLKNNGENFALLQFIQRMEESLTWMREL